MRFAAPLIVKLFALALVFLIVTIHFGDLLGLNPGS